MLSNLSSLKVTNLTDYYNIKPVTLAKMLKHFGRSQYYLLRKRENDISISYSQQREIITTLKDFYSSQLKKVLEHEAKLEIKNNG